MPPPPCPLTRGHCAGPSCGRDASTARKRPQGQILNRGAGPGLLDGTASPPVGGAGDRVLLTPATSPSPPRPRSLPPPFLGLWRGLGPAAARGLRSPASQACLAAGTAAPGSLRGFSTESRHLRGACATAGSVGSPRREADPACWTPEGLTVGQTQPGLAAPNPRTPLEPEPTRTPGLPRPWTELILKREDFPWADAHQEGPR